MPNSISRETFKEMNEQDQRAVMFDMLHALFETQCEQKTICAGRLERCGGAFAELRSQKRVNWFISAIGGAIGGFAAIIGKWIIGGGIPGDP